MNEINNRIKVTDPYINPVHEAMREVAQRMFAEQGVRVKAIEFAWVPDDQVNNQHGPDTRVRIAQIQVWAN